MATYGEETPSVRLSEKSMVQRLGIDEKTYVKGSLHLEVTRTESFVTWEHKRYLTDDEVGDLFAVSMVGGC